MHEDEAEAEFDIAELFDDMGAAAMDDLEGDDDAAPVAAASCTAASQAVACSLASCSNVASVALPALTSASYRAHSKTASPPKRALNASVRVVFPVDSTPVMAMRIAAGSLTVVE